MRITLKSNIQEIDGNAQRQYIDAKSVFTALEEARKNAAEVRGGMLWKNQNGTDYLIRTTTRRGQKSLGPRSEQNEGIFREFTQRKQRVEKRVSDLRRELELHRKLNKVFHVGRAPEILIKILNELAVSGAADNFVVIGTYSLYAYEAAAGIRFEVDGALNTEDVDLLCDARKRLMESKGQEHHFLNHEEEQYVAQAKKAGVLLDGEKFSAMIVSRTGRMARMNTISPVIFAKFKRWMAGQDDRDPLKRQRDILQAELVEEMIKEFFPNLQ
jgi:hypothetical protein